ncbi:MAG: membrane protein insertase YidC [Gammaproteobacteria bacterium]|nr:membrane protein insertase YidC [Gammaproteobacteria bacterium]
MDFQRFFLFTALGLILLLLWQAWLEHNQPQQAPPAAAVDTDLGAATAGAEQALPEEVPSAPDVGQTTAEPTVAEEPPSELGSGTRITVETDLFRAEIDSLGGDLRNVELVKYPVSVDQPDQPFALLQDSGVDIFVAQSGLIGEGREYPNHKTQYQIRETNHKLAPGQDKLQVELTWTAPDDVSYRKIYTFRRNSYIIDVQYRVDNQTATDWTGFLYAQFQRTQVVPEQGFSFLRALPSYVGGAIYTPQDRYDKYDFADMQEQNLKVVTTSGWVAMLQHYFVGAWLPKDGSRYEFYSRVLPGARYNVGYKTLEPQRAAAGSDTSVSTRLFVGPKEQDRLDTAAEGLKLTVDYGWLTPISSPLFWMLRRIHKQVGNWGWAIIILTLLIKLAFYPLSNASYKSMARMKKLQPRLKTLKERYGDDRQKLNQAMMEMYKKDKINPLGGCLPIVIQIPVFIALYWVLLESVELRQAPFIFWLKDLSVQDPYYVLPILMGGSMVVQQFLNPAPLDPVQKNIMMALPVVFTLFFLFFPAGLVLYWVVNNLLSIAQQWHITRRIAGKDTGST